MLRLNRSLLAGLCGLMVSVQAHAAGLLAPTDSSLPPLRVTDHLVDVEIHDQIALTTLDQTFHNDTSRRLEATYVFPLPENAELTNFQMSFNGKMVEGKVLPAEEARRVYESIVRQTKDPGLIEFIGRRLLQMRVFPIEPGSDTKIQVKYQQICKPISGMNGYHYPLRTTKVTGSGQAYGTVRFAIKLDTTAALKNVWSPTHSVEIVRDGEHAAKIAYEASRGSLEDDFLLLYDTDSSDLGLSVIAYKPVEKQPGYFVLTLTPKQLWPKTEYQPQDVVFVIDTSGSMAGEKLDQAKSALKFCIDKLDERDRFSLVRFSTGFDVLFDNLADASKEKRGEARAWVEKFSAAGGTNIMDALKAAMDLRPAPKAPSGVVVGKNDEDVEGKVIKALAHSDRPFVVIFITDGQGNQTVDETMKMVQKHPSSEGTRIFPFGVGHDVNTILLDQLATNFSGKPTYVQPGENLELVLSDFFSVISQPVLTNLKLALPEIGATEKFPATLSDLYHGQQLIIAGKFENPTKGKIKLTAMRNGETVEYVWPSIAFTNTAEAKYVPAIWAGRKISFLIDQLRAHGENNEMIGEVVSLSQEYGIQTPYTSWLVNPERQPELARVIRGAPPAGAMKPPPMTPGSGGTGGGGGGGGVRYKNSASGDVARRALERAGADVNGAPGAGVSVDGDDEVGFDEKAVGQAAGQAATELAKQNDRLRESRSKDSAGRIDQTRLLNRKINERWYNRIGQFLVDENVTDETRLTVVKFGTNAYFEVVQRRPELKEALAASRNIVVIVSDTHAVLISDKAGIEDFSEEQLKQSGL